VGVGIVTRCVSEGGGVTSYPGRRIGLMSFPLKGHSANKMSLLERPYEGICGSCESSVRSSGANACLQMGRFKRRERLCQIHQHCLGAQAAVQRDRNKAI